jgi:hypothetical protein
MIGRVWPFHVDKIAAGTGRVRDFLITRPAMRGGASVALDIRSDWLVRGRLGQRAVLPKRRLSTRYAFATPKRIAEIKHTILVQSIGAH